MKFIYALFFVPFFANAVAIQSIIDELEKRETITPADLYQNGEAVFAENLNEHRYIKVSMTEYRVAETIKFNGVMSDSDKGIYGIDQCRVLFSGVIPNAKRANWDDDTPEAKRLDQFFETIKYDGIKNNGERKAKIKGWNLYVNLKVDQVWCFARKA
jgi:hypothetical protein